MIFTVEDIKNYLLTKNNLEEAINDLTDDAIVNCNQYPKSVHFEKNEKNANKYEEQIGLSKLKQEQIRLRRNTNGTKGKSWLALSPKWIDNEDRKRDIGTEYEIQYWVNYGDGDTYGWFTVEQITKWLTTPELKLCSFGGRVEK